MKKCCSLSLISMLGILMLMIFSFSAFAEEAIDASDPTRIYSYAGGGIKYTDYTNGEHMWEMRVTGNIGLSTQDMVLFEVGYGFHSGDRVKGSSSDFTNGRARWFHIFDMDYSVTSGYRGWATQVDMQVAGSLKGTDGQNTLAVGAMPAFGLGENLSFFLALNVANTWDKDFKHYNGCGLNAAPLLVYSPNNWWKGAWVQIWPGYTKFISGDLSNEGAGNLDVTIGGEITPISFWSLTYQKNYDKDLRSYRRGKSSGLKNDQNIFASVTIYF
ncbi:MAG: hypothetical protein JJV98_18575 [Desulfosarcina sp.]|nr:hypothetical protein [Desulfobacterales bacterium]